MSTPAHGPATGLDLAALDAITDAVESGAGLPEVVRAAARALDASLVLTDRASGGTDDLGQAGARLDGVGDRVEHGEIEPGRRSVGRGGHAPILRRTVCGTLSSDRPTRS